MLPYLTTQKKCKYPPLILSFPIDFALKHKAKDIIKNKLGLCLNPVQLY